MFLMKRSRVPTYLAGRGGWLTTTVRSRGTPPPPPAPERTLRLSVQGLLISRHVIFACCADANLLYLAAI